MTPSSHSRPHPILKALSTFSGTQALLDPQRAPVPINQLAHVAEREDYHPEKNSLVHLGLVMEQAFRIGLDIEQRLACLVHDLGKTITGKDPLLMPTQSHKGHDHLGLPLIENFFTQYHLPKESLGLCLDVCHFHQVVHQLESFSPTAALTLMEQAKARHQEHLSLGRTHPEEDFRSFGLRAAPCFLADAQGRLGLEDATYPQAFLWSQLVHYFCGQFPKDQEATLLWKKSFGSYKMQYAKGLAATDGAPVPTDAHWQQADAHAHTEWKPKNPPPTTPHEHLKSLWNSVASGAFSRQIEVLLHPEIFDPALHSYTVPRTVRGSVRP